ncbi:MAG TPA: hypothetical protein VME47_21055 [Acetobacteraceae bacterium]|nr:hypothetical protein [Acetobacteraceae bacterium]
MPRGGVTDSGEFEGRTVAPEGSGAMRREPTKVEQSKPFELLVAGHPEIQRCMSETVAVNASTYALARLGAPQLELNRVQRAVLEGRDRSLAT